MDCAKILMLQANNYHLPPPKKKELSVPVLNKQSNLYFSQEGSASVA